MAAKKGVIPKINKVDATEVYNIENTYVAKARLKNMPINKSNLSNLFIKAFGSDFVIIQAKIITTKLSDIDLKNNIWNPEASIIIFIIRPTKLIKKPPKRIVNVAFLLVIFAHFMFLLFSVLLFKLIICLAKSFIKNY